MATSPTYSDREISDELSKISTLNGWGILGIFIPIVGLVCYGISHSRTKKLRVFMSDDQREKYKSIIHGKRVFSSIMLIVCILLTIFWTFTLLTAADVQREKEAAKKQEQALQEENLKKTAQETEARKADALSACLLTSETQYNDELRLNSWSSSKDANGQTIYHGDRDMFNHIASEKRLRDNSCHQNNKP